MKHIILLAGLFLTLCSPIFGQQKGQLLIGGFVNYDGFAVEDSLQKYSDRYFEGGPKFALMITKRLAGGIQTSFIVDYTRSTDKLNNFSSTENEKSMFIAPFVRYHGNFTDRILYTGEMTFGKEFRLNGNPPHPQVYRAHLTGGLMYFVAKKVALGINVFSINFKTSTLKNADFRSNELGIDYNFVNPQFEVLFYI